MNKMKESNALALIDYYFHSIIIFNAEHRNTINMFHTVHIISKIEMQIFMHLFYFDSNFYTPAIS